MNEDKKPTGRYIGGKMYCAGTPGSGKTRFVSQLIKWCYRHFPERRVLYLMVEQKAEVDPELFDPETGEAWPNLLFQRVDPSDANGMPSLSTVKSFLMKGVPQLVKAHDVICVILDSYTYLVNTEVRRRKIELNGAKVPWNEYSDLYAPAQAVLTKLSAHMRSVEGGLFVLVGRSKSIKRKIKNEMIDFDIPAEKSYMAHDWEIDLWFYIDEDSLTYRLKVRRAKGVSIRDHPNENITDMFVPDLLEEWKIIGPYAPTNVEFAKIGGGRSMSPDVLKDPSLLRPKRVGRVQVQVQPKVSKEKKAKKPKKGKKPMRGKKVKPDWVFVKSIDDIEAEYVSVGREKGCELYRAGDVVYAIRIEDREVHKRKVATKPVLTGKT